MWPPSGDDSGSGLRPWLGLARCGAVAVRSGAAPLRRDQGTPTGRPDHLRHTAPINTFYSSEGVIVVRQCSHFLLRSTAPEEQIA